MSEKQSASVAIPVDLRSNGVDYGLSAMKALLAVVPAGGFLSELLTVVLPEQRADRFARYVAALQAEVSALRTDIGAIQAHALSSEQLSLFQAGGEAAVKASSDDRVERIAKVAAHGMLGSDLDAARSRRLLGVLSELSDDDVIQLCSHVKAYSEDREWRERHGAILWTPEYHDMLKARRTPHDQMERLTAAIDLQVFRLVSLGLLEEPSQIDLGEIASRLSAHARDMGLATYGVGRPAIEAEAGDMRISTLGVIVLQELGLMPRSATPSSGKEWDAMEAASQ